MQEGYEEYAVNEFYHQRLALLPGTPIYNWASTDSGGYTITVKNFINNPRIHDQAVQRIGIQVVNKNYDPVLAEYVLQRYPDAEDIDSAFLNFAIDIAERKYDITDLDIAHVLVDKQGRNYTTPDGNIDVRRFANDFNMIEYDAETKDGIYQVNSDVYDDKMYIFPLLNAPDGILFAANTLVSVFGQRLGTQESAQYTINQFNPLLTGIFESAFRMTIFGGRRLQSSRTLPELLVHDPTVNFIFSVDSASTSHMINDRIPKIGGVKLNIFPKVRLKSASKQFPTSALKMYAGSDTVYEFESDTDALLFLHYTNLFGFLPQLGRSEKQVLLFKDFVFNENFSIPAGMTHREFFLEIIGLRNVPINSLDRQLAQAMYEYLDRLREFDKGRIDVEPVFPGDEQTKIEQRKQDYMGPQQGVDLPSGRFLEGAKRITDPE